MAKVRSVAYINRGRGGKDGMVLRLKNKREDQTRHAHMFHTQKGKSVLRGGSKDLAVSYTWAPTSARHRCRDPSHLTLLNIIKIITRC